MCRDHYNSSGRICLDVTDKNVTFIHRRVLEGRQVPGTPYLIIAGGIFISFVLSLYIPNPHDENSDVADLFGPNVYSSDSKEGLLQGDSDEVNIVKLFPEVSVDISARATPAPL